MKVAKKNSCTISIVLSFLIMVITPFTYCKVMNKACKKKDLHLFV